MIIHVIDLSEAEDRTDRAEPHEDAEKDSYKVIISVYFKSLVIPL